MRVKRTVLLSLLLLNACGQSADRLTDEEALADAPDIPVNEPVENVDYDTPVVAEPSSEVLYRAVGNEPGWALLVRNDGMLYQGRYGTVRITEMTPPSFRSEPGTYQSGRLTITIAPGPCSDGMSDKAYRDNVTVVAGTERVNGCGGGEVEANRIDRSEWTVTAVNGRPTEADSSYVLNFRNGVTSGMFGCNNFQGSYSSNGDHLFVEQLVATEKACGSPASEFEREGLAVLASNMRMERVAGKLRLVSEVGFIELAPRRRENGT